MTVPMLHGTFEVAELIASAPHFGKTNVTIESIKRIDDIKNIIWIFDILWTMIQDIRGFYLFEHTTEQIGYR